MKARFLSIASIGVFAGLVGAGVFLFASNALAAASIESLKLTAPSTITVVYSQPVYTSPSDYTNFTGSFAGDTVSSVSGSGSNTITLNLANSVASGATGYVTIGTNVQDVSDNAYFPGATWNIISAIGPSITSFGLSSNEANGSFVGTNDLLTFTFNANEQVNILSVTIDGHPISVSGSGSGPFTASYTMQSTDPTQSIPVTFTIADNSNNQTSGSFTYNANSTATGSSGGNSGIVAISSIVSNANTAGVLTNGNSITFTLTPLSPEPSAHVTGSYNGVPLAWATTNGGVNYVATYVVAAGQSSQPVPLQISGVTITDQYGNTSAPASGYDIQKTISVTGAATTASTATATATATTSATTATSNSGISAEIASLESQLTALQTQANSASNSQDGSTGFNFTEFLGVGSQDAQVRALQERLTSDGFYSGPITGFYGTLTQAAVEKFQAAHGIDVKGYVGPGTRSALNEGD